MKLSIAVGGEKALTGALVVFRGFENSISKAAEYGYDGVELSLRTPYEIEKKDLSNLLKKYGISVSAVSTSQVFAEQNISFLDEDLNVRKRLEETFRGFVDVAADFGRCVSIGRIRGYTHGRDLDFCDDLFLDMIGKVCGYAGTKGVNILLEPINRFEADYLNTCHNVADIISRTGLENLKMLPDFFHMNIEDPDICETLAKYKDIIGYLHVPDSDRCFPGHGHLDFRRVFDTIKSFNYNGWVTAEILPKPDPDTAARVSASYLKKLI